MPRVIDLHAHTVCSDGTETPAELVAAAAAAGVDVIAITDHDSTGGWQEAREASEGTAVTVLPGIELSTQLDYASVHILGYLVDPHNRALVDEMARTREERFGRAEAMVRRIAADYDVSWDDVLAQTAVGATIGRPHIADALVAKGIVPDRSAAFASVLHWRGGYYRPHRAPLPADGVRLIREAGGVPVIAHPGARGPDHLFDDARIRSLVDAGLAGIEVDHRDNPPVARERWAAVAERYDLIRTGSSDYHGDGKPNRLAENTTSEEQFQRLLATARS